MKRSASGSRGISLHRGFTLIEVLVALAVTAIALGALIRGGAGTASNADHLRNKTFAHWVAMNQVAGRRLDPDWPATGRSDGTAQMAGRRWYWEQVVAGTQDPDIRRLTVRVAAAAEAEPLMGLVAFVPRPTRR